jgi:hypothetical protein
MTMVARHSKVQGIRVLKGRNYNGMPHDVERMSTPEYRSSAPSCRSSLLLRNCLVFTCYVDCKVLCLSFLNSASLAALIFETKQIIIIRCHLHSSILIVTVLSTLRVLRTGHPRSLLRSNHSTIRFLSPPVWSPPPWPRENWCRRPDQLRPSRNVVGHPFHGARQSHCPSQSSPRSLSVPRYLWRPSFRSMVIVVSWHMLCKQADTRERAAQSNGISILRNILEMGVPSL